MTNVAVEFSVIVAAYNSAQTIGACLTALQNQTMDASRYEIIVIDDGSTDGTSEITQKTNVTVVRQENRGQAAARNAGIRLAKGDIICCTDADCIPAPNWLEELTRPLLEDPRISGGKGVYKTAQTGLTARFVQMEYEDKYDRLRHFPRITFVDTYSAVYRKTAVIDVGCFDERFPVAEDRELSYRLAAAGYEMVFVETAVVSHTHADTVPSYFHKKILNGYWAGQAISHFPERSREDSYTPQTMKLQVGLIALFLASAFFAIFSPVSRIVSAIMAAIFTLTTLPFIHKNWRKDKAVALAAPFYLALRALALGIGFTGRILRKIEKQK